MDTRQEERNKPFDPYHTPRSDKMKAIVEDVINQVENYEKYRHKRLRRRNLRNQIHFKKIITALVCGLTHEHLVNPGVRGMIPREKQALGKKDPLKPEIYTEALIDILDALAAPEMSFVNQTKGKFPRRTVISAGQRLIGRIKDHKIVHDDLDTVDAEEPIILKGQKNYYGQTSERIPYKESWDTKKYRAEMQEVNSWLKKADIQYASSLASDLQTQVDISDRCLKRIFTNGSFKSGGRLAGGFWQNLKGEHRNDIRVNGEQVIQLDYGQILPRLLYSEAGANPPDGDIYAIPGFENARDGLKKIMAAMQFFSKRMTRFPKDTKELFPKGCKLKTVIEAIETKHAPIKDQFFKNKGHEMQFHESQILVRLLLKLKRRNITALPIHDCVIVAQSKAEEVRRVMKDVFKEYTGHEIPVSQK